MHRHSLNFGQIFRKLFKNYDVNSLVNHLIQFHKWLTKTHRCCPWRNFYWQKMLFRMISLEICGKIARGACRVAVDGWWLRRSSAGVKSSTASASGLGLWDPPTLPPVHHPVQLPTKITKKNGKNCSKTSENSAEFLKKFQRIRWNFNQIKRFIRNFQRFL